MVQRSEFNCDMCETAASLFRGHLPGPQPPEEKNNNGEEEENEEEEDPRKIREPNEDEHVPVKEPPGR